MTEGTDNVERAEDLVGKKNTITDTIPAQIFDAVERYYTRYGYRLQSYTLVTSGNYEATFVHKEESA